MLLLIDIGNTQTTIGFYEDRIHKKILRIKTVAESRNMKEYSYILTGFIQKHRLHKPEGAVVCSVVPVVTPLLISAVNRSFGVKPINVDYKIKTGLKFALKNIRGLGTDRIANAVAARKLYKGNLIVVDFGTATTFCLITAKGEFRGGAIMPGLRLSADVLAEKTAKLPRVELKLPDNLPGRDTNENICTGVILGHAGAVEKIIGEIAKGFKKNLTVVATGGLAGLVTPYTKAINYVNPLLTLEGLRYIYELNT
jgi:type III pantothenate kinase